jgi:hypothetical protein
VHRDVEGDIRVLARCDAHVAPDRIGRGLARAGLDVRRAVAPDRQRGESRKGRAFKDHDIVGTTHRAVRVLERARRPNPQLSVAECSVERDRHVGVGGAAVLDGEGVHNARRVGITTVRRKDRPANDQ